MFQSWTAIAGHMHGSHLVSRQSRTSAWQLVWRRKHRWAWWERGRGLQNGGLCCTWLARTESQRGRRAYSCSRPTVCDRRLPAAIKTHVNRGHQLVLKNIYIYTNQILICSSAALDQVKSAFNCGCLDPTESREDERARAEFLLLHLPTDKATFPPNI